MLELFQMEYVNRVINWFRGIKYYSLIFGSLFLVVSLYVYREQGWINAIFGILSMIFLVYGWFDIFLQNKVGLWRVFQFLVLGIVLSLGFQKINNFLYLEFVLFTGSLIIYLFVVLITIIIVRIRGKGVGDRQNGELVRDVQKEIAKEKMILQMKDLEKELDESSSDSDVEEW